jgi:RNA polymerase primary sigma factor
MAGNDLLTTYLQGMLNKGIKTLTKEEEKTLATLIASGDEKALETLITHNLRLVVFVVRKMSAWQNSLVPAEDLVQMGNEGLILAAKKWPADSDSGFGSFAGAYIQRHVTRQLDNNERLIRLPVNVVESIKKMNYLDRKLKQTLGRDPSPKELATLMGVPAKRIAQLKGYVQREPQSLDAILNDNHEETSEE